MTAEQVWLGVGLLGQALFSGRFLVQWIASERRRRSVLPREFWFFSVGGGLALLAYAIHRLDPVFILGQAAGLAVYARNLYFIYRRPPAADLREGPEPARDEGGATMRLP
jgi:lipid-A-disaccharide synthase-like uncharacterized protein